MKTTLLLVGLFSVVLTGCFPTTAVIADISETKVVIASNNSDDDEKGTIAKEAQRGCDIAKPGSQALGLSWRCTLLGDYNVCYEYQHLFACR